jgi:glucose dehydrogenase
MSGEIGVGRSGIPRGRSRRRTADAIAYTSDGRLLALNAKTGKPVPGFGNDGAVHLRDLRVMRPYWICLGRC